MSLTTDFEIKLTNIIKEFKISMPKYDDTEPLINTYVSKSGSIPLKSFVINLPLISNFGPNVVLRSRKRKLLPAKDVKDNDDEVYDSDDINCSSEEDDHSSDDDWYASPTTTKRRRNMHRFNSAAPVLTKSFCSSLVREIFNTFFREQLDMYSSSNRITRLDNIPDYCGVCEPCQLPDCGDCRSCRNKVKFGGVGTQQRCMRKTCLQFIREYERNAVNSGGSISSIRQLISWLGESYKHDSKTYYRSVLINNEKFNVHDCVLVKSPNRNENYYVGTIMSMWSEANEKKLFHVRWFYRSCETILGETGNPLEVFLSDECDDCELSSISCLASVVYIPANKTKISDTTGIELPNDEKSFFYTKWYTDTFARFETPVDDPVCPDGHEFIFCPACKIKQKEEREDTPIADEQLTFEIERTYYARITWKREEYRVGTCVFIKPETFPSVNLRSPIKTKPSNIDEQLYPELYRKRFKHALETTDVRCDSFEIGVIKSIFISTNDDVINIRVNRLYRPKTTFMDEESYSEADLNVVFWSDEECDIQFVNVAGKCFVAYEDNIDKNEYWSEGPYRFYFKESYDPVNKKFGIPPPHALKMSPIKNENGNTSKDDSKWPKLKRALRCLDVFSGCGGLAEGLIQSGVAECRWAVELDESAAGSLKKNHPNTTVFVENCNDFLKMAVSGSIVNGKGQKLPQKGDVELLCGGPPCQGFSLLNRYSHRDYSKLNNSLIATFLSYCDYYRPRFFILENVRQFISYKKNIVLKLTMSCLLRMGYQCTFALLDAAHFGVPQKRTRVIILAAAPGEILPKHPEPLHVHESYWNIHDVNVFSKTYSSTCAWLNSAPYRTIVVKDAISDLPVIKNGDVKEPVEYNGKPRTHFQRLMRKNVKNQVRDHVSKFLKPLEMARIVHIPKVDGADWRDLPNKRVLLSDGTKTELLCYLHHDNKQGKSSTGSLRGVCQCASGKKCFPVKQPKTLIPWSVVHTANKNNDWSGVYGRLSFNKYTSTVITDPELMGRQGRLIHPTQDRMITVRECARFQGFPDSYSFVGDLKSRYKQIGNAVPPPVAIAIGREVVRALTEEERLVI